MKDLLKDQPMLLQKLAEHVHNLVISADTEHLALIQANTLELAFRHILNEILKIVHANAQSETALRRVKSTVSASKLQLLDGTGSQDAFHGAKNLQQENLILKEQLNYKHDGNIQLQQEVEALHNEKSMLTVKLSRMENELQKCMTEERLKHGDLQDRYHEILGKCKIAESIKASLEAQLETAHEDYQSLVRELKKAKQKIAKKRELFNALRNENYQLKAELESQKAAMNNLKLDLSMESQEREDKTMNETSREEMRLHSENGRLAEVISRLTEDIKALRKEKHEQEILAHAEQQDLATTICELEQKLDNKDDEIVAIKEQILKLKESLHVSRAEQEKLAEKNESLSVLLEKIRSLFGGKAGYQELPDLIRKSRDHSALKQRIATLNSLVTGMSVFVSDLLNGSGKFDFRDDLDRIPSSTYDSLRESIVYCREYASECGVSVDFSIMDAVFGSEKEIRRALVSASEDDLVAIFSIFASIARNITEKYHSEVRRVKNACAKLNIKADKNPILEMVKYQESLHPIASSIADLLHQTYGVSIAPEKVLRPVRDYLQEFIQIIGVLERELGPYTSNDCQPVDIPIMVRNYINDVKVELEQAKYQIKENASLAADLTNANEKLDQALDRIQDLELRRADLMEKLQAKDARILEITEQVEDLTESKKYSEEAIATQRSVISEKDINCQLVKNERDRLKRAIVEKTRLFDERIEEAIKAERTHHKEQIARLEKRYTAQQEVLKCEVEEKTKKLSDTKQVLADLKRQLEETQEKSQKRIAELEHQNQRLATSPRKQTSLSQEDQDILRTANSQRSVMMSKLNEFSSSCNTEISIESGLVEDLGLLLDKCFKSSGAWTDRRVKKAVGILISRVMTLEQMSSL